MNYSITVFNPVMSVLSWVLHHGYRRNVISFHCDSLIWQWSFTWIDIFDLIQRQDRKNNNKIDKIQAIVQIRTEQCRLSLTGFWAPGWHSSGQDSLASAGRISHFWCPDSCASQVNSSVNYGRFHQTVRQLAVAATHRKVLQMSAPPPGGSLLSETLCVKPRFRVPAQCSVCVCTRVLHLTMVLLLEEDGEAALKGEGHSCFIVCISVVYLSMQCHRLRWEPPSAGNVIVWVWIPGQAHWCWCWAFEWGP